MHLLGVVIRTRPEHLSETLAHLGRFAGLEIGHNPGDGRLTAVIEDAPGAPAAQTLTALAQLPRVLSTALVYEYSDPRGEDAAPELNFQSWRGDPGALQAPTAL